MLGVTPGPNMEAVRVPGLWESLICLSWSISPRGGHLVRQTFEGLLGCSRARDWGCHLCTFLLPCSSWWMLISTLSLCHTPQRVSPRGKLLHVYGAPVLCLALHLRGGSIGQCRKILNSPLPMITPNLQLHMEHLAPSEKDLKTS